MELTRRYKWKLLISKSNTDACLMFDKKVKAKIFGEMFLRTHESKIEFFKLHGYYVRQTLNTEFQNKCVGFTVKQESSMR